MRGAWEQARSHGGDSGQCPPNSFCASLKSCSAQKNLFQINNKNKNRAPLNIYFAPPNPKTWLRTCWGVACISQNSGWETLLWIVRCPPLDVTPRMTTPGAPPFLLVH